MTSEPPPLSKALATAAETTEFLASRADLFRSRFATNVPYDRPIFQFELEDSANRLQDSILRLARSTLHEVDGWSKGFVEIDTELNEIEALFQRVKSETSSSLVSSAFPPSEPYEDELVSLPYPKVEPYKFPDSPFDMNMAALEGLGHQLADIQSGKPERMPLIWKLPPGTPAPDFWSRSADYFAPAMSAMLTTPDSAYATTFSDFFKFSPVPGLVVEQRQLMEKSMRRGTT
jgi:hypothetical protein